jgi:hypothetical protein
LIQRHVFGLNVKTQLLISFIITVYGTFYELLYYWPEDDHFRLKHIAKINNINTLSWTVIERFSSY